MTSTYVELMDAIKHRYSLKTDAELARFIGATPNDIWQARNRNKNLSAFSRWKILDKMDLIKDRDSFFASLGDVMGHDFAHEAMQTYNKIGQAAVLGIPSEHSDEFNSLLADLANKATILGVSKSDFGSIAEAAYESVLRKYQPN